MLFCIFDLGCQESFLRRHLGPEPCVRLGNTSPGRGNHKFKGHRSRKWGAASVAEAAVTVADFTSQLLECLTSPASPLNLSLGSLDPSFLIS